MVQFPRIPRPSPTASAIPLALAIIVACSAVAAHEGHQSPSGTGHRSEAGRFRSRSGEIEATLLFPRAGRVNSPVTTGAVLLLARRPGGEPVARAELQVESLSPREWTFEAEPGPIAGSYLLPGLGPPSTTTTLLVEVTAGSTFEVLAFPDLYVHPDPAADDEEKRRAAAIRGAGQMLKVVPILMLLVAAIQITVLARLTAAGSGKRPASWRAARSDLKRSKAPGAEGEGRRGTDTG